MSFNLFENDLELRRINFIGLYYNLIHQFCIFSDYNANNGDVRVMQREVSLENIL